jgi:signal transduction histidine kinase/GAF domain-containing protein/PAS domain-containing protein
VCYPGVYFLSTSGDWSGTMEARTYTSIQEESAIIERIARIVSSVRGTKPDYARLAAELRQAIPFEVFGIVLLRHDRQAVRVAVCRLEAGNWSVNYHQHPLSGSMLEHVLKDPALVVRDYPDGLNALPGTGGDALSGSPQLRSTLIAPLLVEDRVLGTLELGSSTTNIYANQTLQRLVCAVTRVVATAIESVQMGGSAAIQDRQRQVLKDVTSALTSKIDLPTILNRIVTGIANNLNVAAIIVMLDQSGAKLHLHAQSGMDSAVLEKVLDRQLWLSKQCIIGQTIQQRQPLVSHDIAVDEQFPDSRLFFTELGVHSIFSYPLVTGSTVFGALLLCSPEPGGFTPLKEDIFSLFASQATIAIHNGMLLESAHRRSRFQEAIEQFERVQAHHRLYDADARSKQWKEASQQEELELLAHVREEVQRTFGISFTSLLRFISDHLLTQNERDLQAMFSAYQTEPESEINSEVPDPEQRAVTVSETLVPEQKGGFANTLTLLTRMAEVALVRTGMVGELSRLIMQLKQSTSGVKDAWYVVDLQGYCVYMNPAAETLCEMRMEDTAVTYNPQLLPLPQQQNMTTKIENIFVKLLPRMRNANEMYQYLQDFTQERFYKQELRCVLSLESLLLRPMSQKDEEEGDRVESAPSDNHYQFIRHPLCNQDGLLVANALQVCDITEQVRDEKNRSALLSSVSHDLRTPLTTIKAAVTGLLQKDVEWDENDRYEMLEDIDAEADHLTVLVNALVELSRIEMGALILEKEWCDVVEIIYGTLAKMHRVLADRPLRTDFQSSLPLVYADHARLERVFANLLENAIERSPAHTEIEIKLEAHENLLVARVIDCGGSIPEHERERIFKSFYSLRSYGNGLGLAICKGLVEAHHGQIWVEAGNSENSGACFVFTLPAHPHTTIQTGQAAVSALHRGGAR